MISFPFLLALLLAPADAATHLFRGVRVETGTGEVLEATDVLIQDGVVAAIGATLDPPWDAVVVDGHGLVMVPGFIDAYTTLLTPEPAKEAARAAGAAAAAVDEGHAWGMAPDNRRGLKPEYRVADDFTDGGKETAAHRAAGFTTVLSAPRENGLSGCSALIDLGEGPRADRLLLDHPLLHLSFRSPAGGGYPSTLMGTLAHVRQFLLDAERNEALWRRYDRLDRSVRRPPLDRAYTAVAAALRGDQIVAIEATSAREIDRVLAFAKEWGFAPAIVGGNEADRAIDRLVESGAFVILALEYPEAPKGLDDRKAPAAKRPAASPVAAGPAEEEVVAVEDAKPDAKKPDAKNEDAKKEDAAEEPESPRRAREDLQRARNERIDTARALADAGVPFALTTRGLKPSEFRENLALAIDRGLPRDVALAALTFQAARLIGASGVLGVVREGARANLAVFDGDPLAKSANVRYVFVGGRKYEFDPKAKKEGRRGGRTREPVPVAGTWTVTVELEGGAREYTIELAQEGETLSGSAAADSGTGEISAGSVKDGRVEFTVVFSFGSRTYDFEFEGELDGDELSGTVSINGGASSPWTGRRVGTPSRLDANDLHDEEHDHGHP